MSDYKIKSRIWIEVGDNVLVGEGRVKLLKEIEAQGSLSKAAKSIGMSYKKAWTLIDAVNKSAKEAVVTTSVGGQKGGGTVITPYGKNLIAAFERINKKCWEFLDEEFETLNGI
ncbi:winged helix-turn-helix domain-containing protein [Zobellia laminariae]|uniref:LysR family transcriptional regulator n=1 Tax=Zobellia barbeyronii TaxID=2748009 RepID=A0ABS5WFA6_9FLAO|nr:MULTISPECIES: winged helix-turn-helix domain-containing protein [Zobellia]MBT2160852.1 LysR family transcriptional regulator [Zobellia barbeyronii]MUH40216.1 LysR family transcriptional regulator [Zobellia laminariae]WKX75556.1 winged helix-turn-helix domain-containing protein [Zobellia laminariae]